MSPYRIAIQGATSLLGKELHTALDERRFPALPPILVDAPASASPESRTLTTFGDEAAVLDPCTPETLADCDIIFLAGTAAEAAAVAPLAPARALLVDLSGGLRDRPDAVLAGLEPPPVAESQHTAVVAHPAAQALAHLYDRLAAAGALTAVATVFEPVSQRGFPAMHELEQQSLHLLGMQSVPQDVLGCQVAFNLRARLGPAASPKLGDVRRRIASEISRLHPGASPALTLLQAPLFHACLVSLYVSFSSPIAQDALLGLLSSPWLAPGPEYPDVVSAAGTDQIQLGPVRHDPAGGFWLWAGVDNLRRTAFSAVDAALAWRGLPEARA